MAYHLLIQYIYDSPLYIGSSYAILILSILCGLEPQWDRGLAMQCLVPSSCLQYLHYSTAARSESSIEKLGNGRIALHVFQLPTGQSPLR